MVADLNECDSDPCQNGGECRNGDSAYTCGCTAGHSGDDCEIGAACIYQFPFTTGVSFSSSGGTPPGLSPQTSHSGYTWPRRTHVADDVVSPHCFTSSSIVHFSSHAATFLDFNRVLYHPQLFIARHMTTSIFHHVFYHHLLSITYDRTLERRSISFLRCAQEANYVYVTLLSKINNYNYRTRTNKLGNRIAQERRQL